MGGNFGSDPASLLKLRSSLLKLGSEFKAFGRNPDKKLCEMSNDSRDLRLVMEGGREPENELDRRVKLWSLEREEMEDGMGPEKEFSERSRVESWVS